MGIKKIGGMYPMRVKGQKMGGYKSIARRFLALLFVAILLLSLVPTASAGWQARKPIEIDHTKVVADLTDFPVLISITDTDLVADAQDDGDDIVFTDEANSIKLDHEIEYFNGTTGELVAWVRIPSLSGSQNTTIYMWYNNSECGSQQNPTGVWDSNYKGAWHLKEDPSGGVPQMADSSSNSNDITSSGSMTSGDQVAGQIDGSLELDATDDYISRTYDSDFDFGTGSFATSGWFKTSGSSASNSVSIRVNQDSDDAEELISNGNTDLGSSDLELIYDDYHGGNQEVGIRFQNVAIPQGATVTNASIQFTSRYGTDSGTTSLTIYGEDTDDASTFSSTNGDITGRTKTSASVSWNNIPAWDTIDEADADQRTSDIKSIIQEIVDRAGWSSGNSLAIIVDGTGERTAWSHDGKSSAAPLLVVTYTSPQYLLARYDSDQGFKVWMESSGKISFGLDDDSTWGPDIKVTSTSTYDDNNWHYFTAVMDGSSTMRLYVDGSQVASDSSLDAVPGSVSIRVSQDSDDAEEAVSSGSMDLTSSDLELVVDGSTDQEVGTRFQSVTIPQGATITSAYIQFTVDEIDSGACNLTIYGEDIDNALTFTDTPGNITGRKKTTASVAWSPPAWYSVGAAGADQQTSDISSIIQDIVDRAGWSSGNALAIIVDGTGERTAWAYDGSASAPLLVVDYTTTTISLDTLTSNSAPLTFGSDEPTNADYFNGILDEVRISNTVRSANWILTSYNNQNSAATFYTVGSETPTGGANPVPELPTILLLSVGVIALAGYVLLRRQK